MMRLGRASLPIRLATCSRSSVASSSEPSHPSLRETNATIACPVSGSLRPVAAASAYLMKSPPKQLADDIARTQLEQFIAEG